MSDTKRRNKLLLHVCYVPVGMCAVTSQSARGGWKTALWGWFSPPVITWVLRTKASSVRHVWQMLLPFGPSLWPLESSFLTYTISLLLTHHTLLFHRNFYVFHMNVLSCRDLYFKSSGWFLPVCTLAGNVCGEWGCGLYNLVEYSMLCFICVTESAQKKQHISCWPLCTLKLFYSSVEM